MRDDSQHYARSLDGRDGNRDLPQDEALALRSLRRAGELWLLAGLLTAYGVVYSVGLEGLYETMNLLGPFALALILGWSCYKGVSASFVTIWAPLLWFRLACSVYFGFGSLVPIISDEPTRQYIYTLYRFTTETAFKVNLIFCFGIFMVLVCSYVFLGIPAERRRVEPTRGAQAEIKDNTLFYAALFLVVGGVLRYGIDIPYQIGLFDFVVPGAISALSKSYYVGVYLLILHANNHRSLWPVAVAIIVIDVSCSIATFAKTELLLILIFSVLGLIHRKNRTVVIVVGSLVVLLSYFSFQPLVDYGRAEIAARYGGIRGGGLGDRLQIVGRFFEGGYERVATPIDRGLSRLSYTNAAAFVVDRFDAGAPGTTFSEAAAVLVPRVLWPEKPIISQLGSDLDYLVYGRVGTSSLGIGHFAEAYWNFGWIGIPFVMAILAIILTVTSRVSIGIIARRDWLYLPVVFLSINMGIRVDGHFVPDILGPAWTTLLLWMFLTALKAMAPNLLGQHVPMRSNMR